MLVNSHSEAQGIAATLATYDDTEREYIRRLINGALCMRFWTAPHLVPHLCTDNGTARGEMCSVFEISELHPLDYDSIMILLRFN